MPENRQTGFFMVTCHARAREVASKALAICKLFKIEENFSEKTKLAARRGRKATGLFMEEKIAGLPGRGSSAFFIFFIQRRLIMKRQRWVWLVLLAAVAGFSWAPVALASSLSFTINDMGPNSHVQGITRIETVSGGFSWYLNNYTPTEAGLVSQHCILEDVPITAYIYSLMRESNAPPGPSYIAPTTLLYSPQPRSSIFYQIYLDQSGPLRFTDLAWEAKMLKEDGSETTIFSLAVDADHIANGGWIYGDVSYSFGTLIFPAELFYEEHGPYVEPAGWYYEGNPANIYVTYTLSVTGHVIDTTAPAPIPSALLLVGSGLVRLALYGRRKLVSRN